ncbi:MAG: hypothetical protein A3C43_06285 [Candidatus Schekmanbacteria bacterium RIFCSPHIGHO2_02_FULL_38_11]|uniref:O-antigen ligase-related domain-containing protein n=1 Tax=Candidatus Schekmanbacteria bacterium RIFCSPLOWO2_12_FULL_38_15 TaxID=1817883 RepID=A0A1F7SDS2_9BACT|nr:MAG: hypothetical protein A3C43_06285 [Candidatus Schekmanbacteria bacterium RIFCSPHIGHO2_02_FULL_38_11]OGL51871.1 MAG: hypothetical protein A3G31_05675 [Candidatus Schekmanbacteria bacterium RIFCSPLOWO2_12_FULL_38_15]
MSESKKVNKINIFLLSFLILFSPLIEGGTTYFPVTVIRILSLILLSSFFYSSFKEGSLRLKRTGFDICIVLFFLISVISVFVSSYKNISIQWIVSISTYLLIFYLTINIVKSGNDEKIVLGVLIAVLAFQSVYGISQRLILGVERVNGTFFNPNFYGSYLGAGILSLTGFLFHQKENASKFSKKTEMFFFSKVFLSSVLILAFLAIFLSQSRGAFLSFLAGLSFMSFYLFKFNKKTTLALLLVVLLILLLPNPLKTRITNLQKTDIYAFSRVNIWESSLPVILDNPFGIGPGMYKYYFPRYNFPVREALAFYGKRAYTSHCEYIQICTELGIAGLLIFLSGIFFFYRRGLKIINGTESSYEKSLNVCLMAGVTVFLFHALFDSVFHEPAVVISMAVFSGMVMRKSGFFSREIKFNPNKKITFLIFTVLLTFSAMIFVTRLYLGYYFSVSGKSLLKNSSYVESDKEFKKAVYFNPADSSFYDARASLFYSEYLDSKDPEFLEKASDELYSAISLNPKNAALFDHLGFILSTLSEKEKDRDKYLKNSLKCYLEAIKLDPFNAYYRESAGRTYLNLNQTDTAIREFKFLLSLEPNFLPARVNLLGIYEKIKRDDLAKEEAERILKIYEKYKSFPFSGDYEKGFLKIDIDEIKAKAK